MEIVISTSSNGANQNQYQDGDIVQSFSDNQIHLCHAQLICNPRNFSFNNAGLRDPETLLEKYMAKSHKYKLVRVNTNDVEKTNLLTNETSVINETPNANGEFINASKCISSHLSNSTHGVFGVEQGLETWYEQSVISINEQQMIDDIWQDIEANSDYLKADHSLYPLGGRTQSNYLVISCCGDSFGVATRQSISNDTCFSRGESVRTPDTEEQPSELVAKRKWQVPYWDISNSLGISVEDIRNPGKISDLRELSLSDMNILDSVNLDKVAEGIVVETWL
tara:strand:+ start:1109 stop:1948 length:840 start_codon:yes stop_codon:yes gene_type:complete